MNIKSALKYVVTNNKVLSLLYEKVYMRYILWKRCKIAVRDYGRHNELNISKYTYSNDFIVAFHGDNNIVTVGDRCTFKMTNRIYIQGNNNVVKVGDNVTFDQDVLIVAAEGTKVTIGSDCIFANHVHIRTSDQHCIFNESGERINPAEDVHIGNHVWLGRESVIMKGVSVGDGAIVGMRSMVTKDVPERCIVVGTPAKVIKTNVNWHE